MCKKRHTIAQFTIYFWGDRMPSNHIFLASPIITDENRKEKNFPNYLRFSQCGSRCKTFAKVFRVVPLLLSSLSLKWARLSRLPGPKTASWGSKVKAIAVKRNYFPRTTRRFVQQAFLLAKLYMLSWERARKRELEGEEQFDKMSCMLSEHGAKWRKRGGSDA